MNRSFFFLLRRVRHMRRIWRKTAVLVSALSLLAMGREGQATLLP